MKKMDFSTPELSVEELNKALYETSLKLEKANKTLQDEQRKKMEFYANISHDLRAPITALSTSIQYLLYNKDELEKEELASNLDLMQKRVSFLEQLINDMFFMSSLDSTNQKLEKKPIEMGFFLEDFFYMCEADKSFENVDLGWQ